MMSSLFGEIIPVFFLISFWRVDRSLADEFWFEKYIFTGRKKTLSASADDSTLCWPVAQQNTLQGLVIILFPISKA